jgi:hypothetical protein
MAQARTDTQREWARLGALGRLQQIEEERAAILAAFPDLRRRSSASPPTSSGLVARKRRTISPKGRQAMSAGMRKYWAKRRAAEQKSKS